VVVLVHGTVELDATQGDFIFGSHYGYGGEIGSDETEYGNPVWGVVTARSRDPAPAP
jgi:hypothetical protein